MKLFAVITCQGITILCAYELEVGSKVVCNYMEEISPGGKRLISASPVFGLSSLP